MTKWLPRFLAALAFAGVVAEAGQSEGWWRFPGAPRLAFARPATGFQRGANLPADLERRAVQPRPLDKVDECISQPRRRCQLCVRAPVRACTREYVRVRMRG